MSFSLCSDQEYRLPVPVTASLSLRRLVGFTEMRSGFVYTGEIIIVAFRCLVCEMRVIVPAWRAGWSVGNGKYKAKNGGIRETGN